MMSSKITSVMNMLVTPRVKLFEFDTAQTLCSGTHAPRTWRQ